MTLFNVSLCLPKGDIEALIQQRSVVAVTKRFILPEKSFALQAPKSEHITHWAQCVFCQQIEEEAIAEIAGRTLWTEDELRAVWSDRNTLFLSILQAYKLPKPIRPRSVPAAEQLYRFLPLAQYLEASNESPVLSAEEFLAAKTAFLEPSKESTEKTSAEDTSGESQNDTEPAPKAEAVKAEDVLESPEWVSKITEYGHSSNGHIFEKLVRKALIQLGFSNSQDRAIASLDPTATGGAGGLDFYADKPYQIVGECKASKHDRINSDAATQIVRLGLQNLPADEYLGCIKIVVAAGALTRGANQIAEGHRINIIRPHTVQRLVEAKIDFDSDFDIIQLESYLEAVPFGEAADQKLNRYLDECLSSWEQSKEYNRVIKQLVSTLQELSAQPIASPFQDFSTLEIRAHHNAKYKPIVTTSKVEVILQNQLTTFYSQIRKRVHQNGETGYYLKPIQT